MKIDTLANRSANKVNRRRPKKFAFHLLIAASILSLGATAGQAHRQTSHSSHYSHSNDGRTCFKTTQTMRHACNADIVDNYFEESAKCLNTPDTKRCQRGVRQEYRSAKKDCKAQAQGRNSLCRRLPDTGPYIAEINPDDFNGNNGSCAQEGGQNRFYPLVIGTVYTYVNVADEETIVFTVTDETRDIEGVETIVVRDTVYDSLPADDGSIQGERIEDTDDYYAIHANCDIWYFGEVSQNFDDGFLDNLDGSFIAGKNAAQAGIIMLANPMVGDVYRQEFALGDAEDAAEVLDLNATLSTGVPDYECGIDCLKTEDFIANDDAVEFKYYKPGVGFIAEQSEDGVVELILIAIDHPE